MAQFDYSIWLIQFLLRSVFEFDWDKGNSTKNKEKHNVDTVEAEEVFLDEFKIPLGIQIAPEVGEPRFGVLGLTVSGKPLFVCFTAREQKVRVINVRPMNKKERNFYEKIRQE